MDVHSKATRSYNMSRIRSVWTHQEKLAHSYLNNNHISYIMHPKITGNPDILLTKTKTAVFLHGCFWHKCPIHCHLPKTNSPYWSEKLRKNALRDRKNKRLLELEGFEVIVIWEHQIKNNPSLAFKRLII